MSLYLAFVNVSALVGAAVALIRHSRGRVGRGDVGRALMVCLASLLILAAVGLSRRAELTLPDVVLSATWTSVSVAAWWTATRSKLTPPPNHTPSNRKEHR